MADSHCKSRQAKASKIVSILQDMRSGENLADRCLDLGCGIGVIANRLNQLTHQLVAVDVDFSLISRAPSKLTRLQADGLRLPFDDATFDLVICAQVYEHVQDPTLLATEIERILKLGGVCYFSGPNRLWPYEYHYRAWFVHWLPVEWRTNLLSLLRRDPVPVVNLLSYWQLRRLWKRFVVYDYFVDLVHQPTCYPGTETPAWMQHIPPFIVKMAKFATPNVNWVLVKPRVG